MAIPWVRPLVDGILSRKPGFNPRPSHVGFLWTKLQRDIFLQVLHISPVLAFHQYLFIHHRRHIIFETDRVVK
jgi:hypothetical protein